MASTRFQEELGKALADRLGLNPDTTLMEWDAEGRGRHVFITMTTMKPMPIDEYNELILVAMERAKQE